MEHETEHERIIVTEWGQRRVPVNETRLRFEGFWMGCLIVVAIVQSIT